MWIGFPFTSIQQCRVSWWLILSVKLISLMNNDIRANRKFVVMVLEHTSETIELVCSIRLHRANYPVDTLLPRQSVIRSRQLTGGVRDQLETALSLAVGVEQTPGSSSREHYDCGRTGGRRGRITCESLFLASHARPLATMVSLRRLLYRWSRFTNKQASLYWGEQDRARVRS